MSPTVSDKGMQRKLYGDANHLMSALEVKPSVPGEERLGNGALPIISLTLPRSCAQTEVGRLKRKVLRSLCSHSLTPTWDAWEQRSLKA